MMKTFILFLFFSTLALSQNFTIRSLGAHGALGGSELFLLSSSAGALTKLSFTSLHAALDDLTWVWTGTNEWYGTNEFWGTSGSYANFIFHSTVLFEDDIRISLGVIPDATGEIGLSAGGSHYLSYTGGQLDTLMTWRQARVDNIYGTMGFADATYVILITQNVYASIRRTEAGSLWNHGVEVGDLVFTTDSIQVTTAGDYEIAWDLSLSGTNTDHFKVAIFVNNVEQSGKGESARDMSTSNIGSMSGHTILTIAATHWISLRITNTASGNDATMDAGNFNIIKQ